MFRGREKLVGLALIWIIGVVALIVLNMIGGESAGEASLGLGLALAVGSFAAMFIEGKSEDEAEERVEKAKRSSGDAEALLALLDEEDREELRQKIKSRLMDRLSDDGELSSLDALLTEQQDDRSRRLK